MGFFDYLNVGVIGGGLYGAVKIILYALPFIILAFFIIWKSRERAIYKYKVRIFKMRESGKVKEINTKGGFIGRKNSAHFFRIKTGFWFWKYKDLTTTPDPQFMDEEDRVYYYQIDIDTFVQIKRMFYNEGVALTPVESDTLYGAILKCQKIKEVLRVEPAWKKLLPYVALTILAVTFIIAYALLMKSCSS